MLSMETRASIMRHLDDGMKVKDISRILHVSQSAIYALKKRMRDTGSIEPGYRGRCGRPSSLSPEQLQAMEVFVQEQPDSTLEDIRRELQLPIKKSQIANLLHKMGYRLKKTPLVSEQTS